MRLCGHKIRAIFHRYAIVDEATLREGVKKLARLHNTSSAEKVLPLAHERDVPTRACAHAAMRFCRWGTEGRGKPRLKDNCGTVAAHPPKPGAVSCSVSSSGGGIRTPDPRIMIPLLYPLSYAAVAR